MIDVANRTEEQRRNVIYLATAVERLEAAMPSPEEMAYLRNKKLADERASWAFQVVRTYAPWVVSIGSTAGGVVYWLVTHFTWKSGP